MATTTSPEQHVTSEQRSAAPDSTHPIKKGEREGNSEKRCKVVVIWLLYAFVACPNMSTYVSQSFLYQNSRNLVNYYVQLFLLLYF